MLKEKIIDYIIENIDTYEMWDIALTEEEVRSELAKMPYAELLELYFEED